MDRDTRSVVEDHLELRSRGDLDGDIERNYHHEVVLLTGTGKYTGHDGVRHTAGELARYLGPEPRFDIRTLLVEGRNAFIEWSGRDGARVVSDGADSFVVEQGRIVVQTIHYTVDSDLETGAD